MNIQITNHARERFAERWKQSETIEIAAQQSFLVGEQLKRNLQKTMILLGRAMPGYWTAYYRVYKKMVFVYQKEYTKESEAFVLTTVLPLRWIKERRAEMFARYYERTRKNYAPNSSHPKKKNRKRQLPKKMLDMWDLQH